MIDIPQAAIEAAAEYWMHTHPADATPRGLLEIALTTGGLEAAIRVDERAVLIAKVQKAMSSSDPHIPVKDQTGAVAWVLDTSGVLQDIATWLEVVAQGGDE